MTFLLALSLLGCDPKSAGGDSGSGSDDTTDSSSSDDSDSGATVDDPWADHPMLQDGTFYVTAHRGGAMLWPEHTMVAYQGAVDAGTDILELDIHSTSDGVLVVMHDAEVDRTTDGTGPIKAMTLAELKALDAAYWFSQDGGTTYPLRGTGITVPTLDEVLEAHPTLLYNIEIKQQDPPIVDEVIAAVQAAGVDDQTALTSFTDSILRDIREKAPDILTALGAIEGYALYSLPESDYDEYVPPAPLFAAPVDYSGIELDAPSVEKAHRFGVRIHAWTVNDPDEMDRVMAMGVDGIITDDPVTLREKVDAR